MLHNFANTVIAWVKRQQPEVHRGSVCLAAFAPIRQHRDGSCKFVFEHIYTLPNVALLQAHLHTSGYPRTEVGIRGDNEYRGHFVLEVTVRPLRVWLLWVIDFAVLFLVLLAGGSLGFFYTTGLFLAMSPTALTTLVTLVAFLAGFVITVVYRCVRARAEHF